MDDQPDNVVEFDGLTRLDIPPERVLRRALNADLEQVVVVGIRKDGSEYISASCADAADVIWYLQRGQWRMNKVVDRLGEDADGQ